MSQEPKLEPHEKAIKEHRMKPLFFDIETEVHPDVENWITFTEPDTSGLKAPANYKDPVKITAYIQKARDEAIEKAVLDHQAKIAKAPLDADYGKIRAIGFRQGAERGICVMIVPKDLKTFEAPKLIGKDNDIEVENMVFETEADMIDFFWGMFNASNNQTVGYNHISFDLPYLMRRSMDLDVKVLGRPDLRRYQTKGNLDLMGILYNWQRAKGMKFVCERYGIENPNPGVDGSMVADMDDETLVRYAAGDIFMLTRLYSKMKNVYI